MAAEGSDFRRSVDCGKAGFRLVHAFVENWSLWLGFGKGTYF